MDLADLPILGEPPPVELANSLYGDTGALDDVAIDFLATPAAARSWLTHALGDSAAVTAAETQALRRLRDAVRSLLLAVVDDTAPHRDALAVVNRAAAGAAAHAVLRWDEAPQAEVAWRGPRFLRLCAQLATGCIELLTGPDRSALRRCEGPGCSLLFVQHHGRRRFCHESCSHRDRQQRYARRVAGALPTTRTS